MTDLIATCPVCPGETHEVYAGSIYCPRLNYGWGKTVNLSAIAELYSSRLVALARIDGGDPGDEQEPS